MNRVAKLGGCVDFKDGWMRDHADTAGQPYFLTLSPSLNMYLMAGL